MDRYTFPKTARQIQRELEKQEKQQKVEENRRKQLIERAKKERKEMFIRNPGRIDEPTDDIKYFQYAMPDQPDNPRSIKVALVGEANAGKSTLVNRLIKTKVTAVTPKSQTTRRNILGVITVDNTQIVFVDTPGIVAKTFQKSVRRELVLSAWESLFEVELILLVVDCVKTVNQDLSYIIKRLEKLKKDNGREMPPILFIANKSDLVDKIPEKDKVPVLPRLRKHIPQIDHLFDQIFVISALTGKNTQNLLTYLISQAKPRDWTFASSVRTDQSPLELAEEIMREKLYRRLNQEVPYLISLENEGWTILKDGRLRIHEKIIVPKKSMIPLIIGEKGRIINGVVDEANRELGAIFQRPVMISFSLKYMKDYHHQEM
jgi:GTP-binding protein Era